ncbi:SDR family NAD(P)-dependent oxidoreductase [Leifsonia sp. NPDC102414]|uniref:SDR family NAD(P)-dependent oxidoreductase n=1 Tax=Leifsonia sp. NPDC102414 TaxID=3364124 RepID=UPI00382E2DC4
MSDEHVRPSAFILGVTRGIGAATARTFLDHGYAVAGTHRNSAVPDGVLPFYCEASDPGSVQAAITEAAERQGLDTLIVNAGIAEQNMLIRMSDESLRRMFDVNTFGPIHAVKTALKTMLKQRRGSIVLVSSESSRTGIAGSSHYTASKAALEGFARSVAREYGSKGIRINVVAPGATDTTMLAQADPEELARLVATIPLKRIAQPSEIAEVIRWVSESTYMTGATIPVTGGEGMGY